MCISGGGRVEEALHGGGCGQGVAKGGSEGAVSVCQLSLSVDLSPSLRLIYANL